MGFHFSVLEVARDLWQSVIFGSSFRIVDGTSWIHWDGKRFFDAVFISTENCATLAVTISSIRGILVTLWVLDQTLTCFGEYMVSTQPPLPVGLGSDVPRFIVRLGRSPGRNSNHGSEREDYRSLTLRPVRMSGVSLVCLKLGHPQNPMLYQIFLH